MYDGFTYCYNASKLKRVSDRTLKLSGTPPSFHCVLATEDTVLKKMCALAFLLEVFVWSHGFFSPVSGKRKNEGKKNIYRLLYYTVLYCTLPHEFSSTVHYRVYIHQYI